MYIGCFHTLYTIVAVKTATYIGTFHSGLITFTVIFLAVIFFTITTSCMRFQMLILRDFGLESIFVFWWDIINLFLSFFFTFRVILAVITTFAIWTTILAVCKTFTVQLQTSGRFTITFIFLLMRVFHHLLFFGLVMNVTFQWLHIHGVFVFVIVWGSYSSLILELQSVFLLFGSFNGIFWELVLQFIIE